MSYWVIFIGFTLLSWFVSNQLKSKFSKYSKIPTSNGMSGKEVVEQMLRDHRVQGVSVGMVGGQLSDHYNPTNKTINLSHDVYHGRNIAAAAVAAHECGHAIQHAQSYSWLTMRSKLVPVVNFSSKWVMWILLAGIFMIESNPNILLGGILLFGLTTLFSFITLPVEIDASNRAIKWMDRTTVADHNTIGGAKDALKWAAYTYVVAALSSLATLAYYVMIYLGGRRD